MLKSLLITDNIPKLVEYFVADRQIDHSLILILEGSYYRFDNGFNVVGTLGLDSNDVNMGIYKIHLDTYFAGIPVVSSNIESYLALGDNEEEKSKFFYYRWLEGNPNDGSYLPAGCFPEVKSQYKITREQLLDLENNKFRPN